MKPGKFLLALVPILLVAACGGSDDLEDRLDVADPKVRFVHAIPLGPDVTLFRNDVAQSDATNVGYKYASTYFDVETGIGTWRVNTSTGNVQLGALTQIDAKRGNRYTMVAVPGSPAADLMLIDDPYNKGLTTDDARVRAVNASFNAQNIDVYLNPPGTDLATVGPNFAAVGYKSRDAAVRRRFSPARWRQLPAANHAGGHQDRHLRRAGRAGRQRRLAGHDHPR